MKQKVREEFKGLLNGQLNDLIKEAQSTVDEMGASSEKETFPDVTDRATLERDRNFLLRIRDRERKLILKIQDALKRIDNDTFGECSACGGSIAVPRLKARPVTTLCIECKTDAEAKENIVQ